MTEALLGAFLLSSSLASRPSTLPHPTPAASCVLRRQEACQGGDGGGEGLRARFKRELERWERQGEAARRRVLVCGGRAVRGVVERQSMRPLAHAFCPPSLQQQHAPSHVDSAHACTPHLVVLIAHHHPPPPTQDKRQAGQACLPSLPASAHQPLPPSSSSSSSSSSSA